MNLMVCIKQVPEIALITVDSDKSQLNLPQSPGMMNPFDAYAVEEALRLKEKNGGSVTVISLGGKEADYALREALALGADEAIHLTDDAFSNIDAITTANIIAAGIRKAGTFDLILLGKQAVDTDASTIGPAIGGFLNLPAAMFVRKIESVSDGKIVLERMTDEGFDKVTLPLPAVISVVKEINEPRLPSLKGKMMAKKKNVTIYSAADIGSTSPQPGSKIAKVSSPPARPKGEMITGATPEEIAENLFNKLRQNQII